MLEVRGLSCGYNGVPVLQDIDFQVPEGRVLVLLGPNGIGKTTLFKTMLGLLPALGGQVLLDGHRMDLRPSSKDMRSIAYVPQAHTPAFAFSVLEVVLMGRTAQMHAFATPSANDRAAAEATLRELGLEDLLGRLYTEISGGERQMVLIARALVQQPRILVMDEPASSLDLGNQSKLLGIAKQLAHERNISVIMTSHNPDHALLVADDVLLMARDGYRVGPADRILTEELLSHAYGATVRIIGDDVKACALQLQGA